MLRNSFGGTIYSDLGKTGNKEGLGKGFHKGTENQIPKQCRPRTMEDKQEQRRQSKMAAERQRAGTQRGLEKLLILSSRTETMTRLGLNLCRVFPAWCSARPLHDDALIDDVSRGDRCVLKVGSSLQLE